MDSRLDVRTGVPAPLLGEHTEELLEGAGYSAEEVADLYDAGVVT